MTAQRPPQRARRAIVRGLVTAALVATAATAGMSLGSPDGRVVEAAVGATLGAGGEYHRLEPVRIFDSRNPALDVAPLGPKPTGPQDATNTVFDIPVVGRGGLPQFVDQGDGSDANVLAVAVNVTVIDPSGLGYLRAFGAGTPEGNTSLVNFSEGQIVPNSAVLRPGANGELSIRVVTPGDPGTVDVAVDLFGWFSSSQWDERGARLEPIEPGRVFDSREARFGPAPVGPAGTVRVPIRGARSYDLGRELVPNDSAVVGALVNITGINTGTGAAPTYLAALPTPPATGATPTTSNVNLIPGQVRANLSIVPLGADGAIHLYNRAGSTDVALDIVGYLVEGAEVSSARGRVVPLVSPFRAFDTREAEFQAQPLSPARAEDWSFEAFVNDVRIGSEPVGPQLGLLGNLTATDLERQYSWAPAASFLTAYPSATSTAVPEVSNVNIFEGQTVPNLALLRYGANTDDDRCQGAHCVRFYNRAGYLDYLLDVSAVILADAN
ncbi:MAG TPA: hypothetical protein VMQ81_11460 [Acidimicrobiia bacterium]|nr:hypothetical protein [Acidimicrobiia bacterium]